MYKKILVPMALDHGISASTLEIAKALAGGGGDITALHVYEAPQGSASAYLDADAVKESVKRAEAILAEKTAGLEGVTPVMVKGHTYRSIVDFAAEHGVDCIVIGSHRPGFSDYLLGSTAARVVRHAPCAVHVFRSS
jgi:nucleotide-binding universal stress UspA family protein